MELGELATIVAALRAEGSDLTDVEAKAAAGGFPKDTVARTLSAFANTPGGGTLLPGLDETAGFAAVEVHGGLAVCKKALASVARQSVQPPVLIDVDDVSFEGVSVVVGQVHELASVDKPCRVKSGKAYLRSYDGDYPLSEVEEQAFLANRATPTFDMAPVAGTSTADLDAGLVSPYLASCRASSSALAALDDAEVLFRTGVTIRPTTTGATSAGERVLTVAGLLALGIYPQQHLLNCSIQAFVVPRSSDPAGTRASDAKRFDRPIPVMLDEAVAWVARNTRTRVRFGADGHGRDEAEFPAEAVRELLSNALIHRDLGPHALNEPIILRLEAQQLVINNPGGLWGLTVDRLGQIGVSSRRNGYLLRVCQDVRTRAGARVVEGIATGIPRVLATLREAGMAPPRFYDQAIRFTVRVPNHALLAAADLQWLTEVTSSTPGTTGAPGSSALSDVQRHALVAMRHGTTWTNSSLRAAFPMDSREAQRALAELVDAGVAVAEGERRGRTYRLAEHLRQPPGPPGTPVLSLTVDPGPAPRPAATSVQQHERRPAGSLRENSTVILAQLAEGPMTVADLSAATGLTVRQVRYALADLRDRGAVELHGGRGRGDSRYGLTPSQAPTPGTSTG